MSHIPYPKLFSFHYLMKLWCLFDYNLPNVLCFMLKDCCFFVDSWSLIFWTRITPSNWKENPKFEWLLEKLVYLLIFIHIHSGRKTRNFQSVQQQGLERFNLYETMRDGSCKKTKVCFFNNVKWQLFCAFFFLFFPKLAKNLCFEWSSRGQRVW